ncbi:MAG: hypothetical protein CL608_29800 [Anaerolineaceae bacterium]|nr:hypothetical protein [Anaerolineaceae bacterium]
MFDFLRNLTKSAEEKRQEAVAAYLDEALTGRARQQFEQDMAQDDALRQEVEQLLLIKQNLRQLPQREVPRNFILDPAKYGRPARQPWVQAYPVLRAATAMTAFFLIFAFAAGIFTNLGGAEPATSEPAADVAQMESVEVTRVVTETETLAFEAEETADDAEAPAVEEEAMDEFAEAEIATSDEDTEEAAEEMVEEEVAAEEEAAPPAPEATVVPSPVESLQEDTAEDGVTAVEPVVQPTATISPTPTVSTLPRVTPPTPLPERDMDQVAGGEAANDAVADVSETEDDTTTAETTAVLPEEQVQELEGEPLFDPLLMLQIGLGGLLLLLAGLTLYARRQR